MNSTIIRIPKINLSKIVQEKEEEEEENYCKTEYPPFHYKSKKKMRNLRLKSQSCCLTKFFTTTSNSPILTPRSTVTERKILRKLKEENKSNAQILQTIHNRLKSLQKQEDDYQKLLNMFITKNKKEEQVKKYKSDIKAKIAEAKIKQTIIQGMVQQKVKSAMNKEKENMKQYKEKKNIRAKKIFKSTQTEKCLNKLLREELNNHLSNVIHSKRTKVDIDLLQSKINNLNKKLLEKNKGKSELKMMIREEIKQSNELKNNISAMEELEQNKMSQLRATMLKKNVLKRRLLNSIDVSDYSDTIYGLTYCITSGKSKSDSKEKII